LKTLKLVSYNLHGIQLNDEWRFGKIACELSKLEAQICGFQEVINGYGIEDTSYQVAHHMKNITGLPYTTHWLFCHFFNDIYPEGLSIMSHYPMINPVRIDLNENLSCKEKPLLTRFALSAEIDTGKEKILFTSLHLDHHKDRKLRTSQAEKLLVELGKFYDMKQYVCSIITGDFNDLDTSPCIKYFEKHGYKDSYRSVNKKGGNTFYSGKPTVRIDYIMIKGDVNIVKSDLILYDSSLSDHVGILTTISIPETKKGIKEEVPGKAKKEKVKAEVPEKEEVKVEVPEKEEVKVEVPEKEEVKVEVPEKEEVKVEIEEKDSEA
jgi:endonuclease/exonuclease/phosphatase family metal-dependent hydrolase